MNRSIETLFQPIEMLYLNKKKRQQQNTNKQRKLLSKSVMTSDKSCPMVQALMKKCRN